ncbi:MAG: hypothetical protein QXD95_09140 [Nitrososphaeria archaeon]
MNDTLFRESFSEIAKVAAVIPVRYMIAMIGIILPTAIATAIALAFPITAVSLMDFIYIKLFGIEKEIKEKEEKENSANEARRCRFLNPLGIVIGEDVANFWFDLSNSFDASIMVPWDKQKELQEVWAEIKTKLREGTKSTIRRTVEELLSRGLPSCQIDIRNYWIYLPALVANKISVDTVVDLVHELRPAVLNAKPNVPLEGGGTLYRADKVIQIANKLSGQVSEIDLMYIKELLHIIADKELSNVASYKRPLSRSVKYGIYQKLVKFLKEVSMVKLEQLKSAPRKELLNQILDGIYWLDQGKVPANVTGVLKQDLNFFLKEAQKIIEKEEELLKGTIKIAEGSLAGIEEDIAENARECEKKRKQWMEAEERASKEGPSYREVFKAFIEYTKAQMIWYSEKIIPLCPSSISDFIYVRDTRMYIPYDRFRK